MDTTIHLTSGEVIDGVLAARSAEQAAALRQLELALQWARLHPCAEDEQAAYWGDRDLHGESTDLIAGEGAPTVAEFAPAELGAALGISFETAQQLVGDGLELHYRLPRLMDQVRSGLVPVWLARRIAARTVDLGWDAVVFADKMLSATPDRLNQVNAERLVHEARLHFDPDRAVADEDEALEKRGVWLRRGANPATTDVTMILDTDDAELLDQTVGRVAADLKGLGDTDPLDVRRARAAGILADPQFALDLMSGREGASPSAGAGHDWVVHFAPEDFADGTGVADIEKLGAITTDLLATWLARHDLSKTNVRVRPVLDLADDWAVDRHDPPDRMRERVLLLHSTCVFPGCRRDSRACDLDHIEAYVPSDDGRPPGQTRPDNLAPLCRTHHRIKTHTAWTYKRLGQGHFTWTSPTGHHYDVDSTPRHHRRTS